MMGWRRPVVKENQRTGEVGIIASLEYDEIIRFYSREGYKFELVPVMDLADDDIQHFEIKVYPPDFEMQGGF